MDGAGYRAVCHAQYRPERSSGPPSLSTCIHILTHVHNRVYLRVIYAIHCHTHRNLPPPPLPTSPFRLPMMYVAPERPLKNSARAAGLSAGLPSTQVAWMIMALYMLLNSAILWRSSNSLRMYVYKHVVEKSYHPGTSSYPNQAMTKH